MDMDKDMTPAWTWTCITDINTYSDLDTGHEQEHKGVRYSKYDVVSSLIFCPIIVGISKV
jgi:hypothetical protein